MIIDIPIETGKCTAKPRLLIFEPFVNDSYGKVYEGHVKTIIARVRGQVKAMYSTSKIFQFGVAVTLYCS